MKSYKNQIIEAMRTLKVSIIIMALGSSCFAQIPFPPEYVDNTIENCNNNCVTNYQNATQIIAPSTPSAPDNFSNASIVAMFAGQSINLQPGFKAGNYSNGGYYLGQITNRLNENINMAIMYPGTSVNTYQRFEIGIQIPADIQAKIDAFLSNPITPNNPSINLNPYDPSQVFIIADFNPPSPYNEINNDLERNGFYYQDVIATNPYDINNDGKAYSVADDQYPFRVRFAPPYPGTWRVSVTLVINGNPVGLSATGTFNVIQSSNPGLY
jgi:hypothetical protein